MSDPFIAMLALEKHMTLFSSHRAHVIIAPLSSSDEFHQARLLACLTTLATAAIAELTTCIGVYWAAGDTVTETDSFIEAAKALDRDEDQYPILNWVQLFWMDGPKTSTGNRTLAVYTTGLLPFIGRELEFQPAAYPPDVIAKRVIGTTGYLLINGPVLKDGDSIGISTDEKISIRHAEQGQRPGVPVWSMTLDRLDKGLVA